MKLWIETQETKFFLFLDLIWLLKTPRALPGLALPTPQKRRRNIATFKSQHYLTLNYPQRQLSSGFFQFYLFIFSLQKLRFHRSVLCEIKEYFTRLSRSTKEEFKAVPLDFLCKSNWKWWKMLSCTSSPRGDQLPQVLFLDVYFSAL